MKANELRIGNYIQEIESDYSIVQQVSNASVTAIFQWGSTVYGFDDAKPITLTEEWLLKFGFTRTNYNGGHKYTFKNFELSRGNNWENYVYMVVSRNEDGINDFDISVKYVHQLQNLYFELKGEELTIKDK